MYVIEKQDGKQTLTEEQVETKDGPLYRLIAIDGRLLDPDRHQQDNARDRQSRILRWSGAAACDEETG